MYSWRSSILLLSAVIVMAMLVINTRHQARVLTVQLEQARAYEQQLQVEWSTRQVQQVSAAKNDKIAEVVSRQDMQRVDPSVTFYMTPKLNGTAGVANAANVTNASANSATNPTDGATSASTAGAKP